MAGIVAMCNGLSSAQLAANHPVSGGTYEYGYQWLSPRLGFLAGWMFLCAKSASAATAALGFASYLLRTLGVDHDGWGSGGLIAVARTTIGVLTLVVLTGIKRSNLVNMAIVSITLATLVFYISVGCCA